MSTQKVYVGDVGTQIILAAGTEIGAASARSIAALRPDGVAVTLSAVAEGTDSIKHVTTAESLPQAGVWLLQAVVVGSGTWRGETVSLQVYPQFG
jgi:hypothetical protein